MQFLSHGNYIKLQKNITMHSYDGKIFVHAKITIIVAYIQKAVATDNYVYSALLQSMAQFTVQSLLLICVCDLQDYNRNLVYLIPDFQRFFTSNVHKNLSVNNFASTDVCVTQVLKSRLLSSPKLSSPITRMDLEMNERRSE